MMLVLTITDIPVPESFSFDVLDIDHRKANLVTAHPVENAVDVSDHIQRQLDEMFVRAIVTDLPFATVAPDLGSKTPIRAAEDFLDRASTGTVSVALAGRPTVPRMALLSWPWRQEKYGRAVFQLQLREVRIAQALTVKIPPSANTTNANVPSRQDLGQQSPGQADASILSRLSGLGG